MGWRNRRAFVAVLAWAACPCLAMAQAAPTTVTVLIIPEGGASLADATSIALGLRRGLREVEGVRFVHAGDELATRVDSDEVVEAIDELDGLAVAIRDGDRRAGARVRDIAELFEAHLDAVRRANLADAYLLAALAACQRRRLGACSRGFERVVTFRESAEYDTERFPPEHEALFNRTRDRLVGGGDRGSVEVTTDPAGAEVFVDGRSIGPSPATAEGLLVGEHYVTVKAVGYDKVVQRVTVAASYQETVEVQLLQSERALILTQHLPLIQQELGETRAGEYTAAISGYLFVNQVVLGVVRPEGVGGLHVALYVYDLRTRFLLAQREQVVPSGEPGAEAAQRLALDMYRGVDLSGAVQAPEEDDTTGSAPIYEQWWFWTAVGIVAVSGAVTIGVLSSGGDGVPAGWTRIDGQIR